MLALSLQFPEENGPAKHLEQKVVLASRLWRLFALQYHVFLTHVIAGCRRSDQLGDTFIHMIHSNLKCSFLTFIYINTPFVAESLLINMSN